MKKTNLLQILLAFIACHAAVTASATLVSFGFSGKVSNFQNASNTLPASITYGTPFSGIVTYDTSLIVGGKDFDPSTNSGAYYYGANGGLWFSLGIAGHSFDTTQPSPGDPYADILIYNFADPQDAFWVDASAPTLRLDGAVIPGTYTTSGMSFQLFDNTGTAYTNDFLPLVPPDLSAFTNSHYVAVYAYNSQGTSFYLTGDITGIGAPHPILNIRPQAGQTARLSWPTAARGFILLQNTNLVTGSGWQTNSVPIIDADTEHTVTVPMADSMFYQLKLP